MIMVAKVTEQGLWIPRRLLGGMTQVEIRRGKNRISLSCEGVKSDGIAGAQARARVTVIAFGEP